MDILKRIWSYKFPDRIMFVYLGMLWIFLIYVILRGVVILGDEVSNIDWALLGFSNGIATAIVVEHVFMMIRKRRKDKPLANVIGCDCALDHGGEG